MTDATSLCPPEVSSEVLSGSAAVLFGLEHQFRVLHAQRTAPDRDCSYRSRQAAAHCAAISAPCSPNDSPPPCSGPASVMAAAASNVSGAVGSSPTPV